MCFNELFLGMCHVVSTLSDMKQHFRRRRKSLILTILEYYIHLVELAITASQGARKYLERKGQVIDIYNAVKFGGQLPHRSEPIIPHTDSDLESECAESVNHPQSEAGIVHIDDNFEVVKEISEARNCKALGILIPRRGRKYPQQRFAGAQYFRSIVHA